MKFIKFTHVDSVTGLSVEREPAANGPVFPEVKGLVFSWARESLYPTSVPQFFGTCPDDSNSTVEGVLGVFSEGDWNGMWQDELYAREVHTLQAQRLTRLAFRNRFTQAEKVALEIAALDDVSAPMTQRQHSAALRARLADLAASTFVDLGHADTRAGVQSLEDSGLLGAGRAAEILDSPVLAAER